MKTGDLIRLLGGSSMGIILKREEAVSWAPDQQWLQIHWLTTSHFPAFAVSVSRAASGSVILVSER
jgi:hypothetical protein